MSIKDFYTHSLTFNKFSGRNEFGDPLPFAVSTIKGRFEYNDMAVKSRNGEEVKGAAVIFIDLSVDIDDRDFIEYDGIKYRVFQVRKPGARSGIHHQEVILQ